MYVFVVVVSMLELNTKDKCEIFSLVIVSKCDSFQNTKDKMFQNVAIFPNLHKQG